MLTSVVLSLSKQCATAENMLRAADLFLLNLAGVQIVEVNWSVLSICWTEATVSISFHHKGFNKLNAIIQDNIPLSLTHSKGNLFLIISGLSLPSSLLIQLRSQNRIFGYWMDMSVQTLLQQMSHSISLDSRD